VRFANVMQMRDKEAVISARTEKTVFTAADVEVKTATQQSQ
jgi:hypothetical protein